MSFPSETAVARRASDFRLAYAQLESELQEAKKVSEMNGWNKFWDFIGGGAFRADPADIEKRKEKAKQDLDANIIDTFGREFIEHLGAIHILREIDTSLSLFSKAGPSKIQDTTGEWFPGKSISLGFDGFGTPYIKIKLEYFRPTYQKTVKFALTIFQEKILTNEGCRRNYEIGFIVASPIKSERETFEVPRDINEVPLQREQLERIGRLISGEKLALDGGGYLIKV